MENKNGNQAVILSATRTPIGRFLGVLSPLSATQLGAMAIRAAVERAQIGKAEEIDEVLMGNAIAAGLGQAPARQAAIHAGIPTSVGATTINKVCGSGLKAGMFAAQAIRAGDADLIVAGGMESMSNPPYLVYGRNGELHYGHSEMVDALLHDGIWDSFEDWAMGMAAEHIADRFEVTREEMDQWAFDSHRKAIAAIDANKFVEEITAIEIRDKNGNTTTITEDEAPRRDTTLKKLAALKPAYYENGRVTAGNAPGLNDGASALVFASMDKAQQLGVSPLADVVGYAQAAVPPKELFIAPAFAIPKLLEKVNWSPEDVDLIELNEAFAAQVLADGRALENSGWDWDKVNVHGGAIALGHPLGASGARILTTLIYALIDRKLKRGIAALCLGGGEAVAMAIELS